MLSNRRKNERRRASNQAMSPARSEASQLSPAAKKYKTDVLPSGLQIFSLVNPAAASDKSLDAIIDLAQSDTEFGLVSKRNTPQRAVSTATPLTLPVTIPLDSLSGTLSQVEVTHSTPETSRSDSLLMPDLQSMLRQQTALQSQLQWFQNQMATQRFPSPSATVSKPRDSPVPEGMRFAPLTTEGEDDSYLPPSGHVRSTTGADPIYTDSESDKDRSRDRSSGSQDPDDASGPEDANRSPIRRSRSRQRRMSPRPRSESRDSTTRPTPPSNPLSMRLTDPRSPVKPQYGWPNPQAAGRRPIRTPSPPNLDRDLSPAPELSVSDNSFLSQDDFSFKKVMKSIAQLSGAKSGPPKGVKDPRDLPLTMRSQMTVPVPDELVSLETTEAVVNSVLKRQLAFKEDDLRSKSGRTLSRLHVSAPRMNVKNQLYRSADGAIPMEALSQPSNPAIWMPEVHPDSDIPLQERDARVIETLSRQALNISSVQDHTLTAIKTALEPVLTNESGIQELIQTLSLSIRDTIKVSSHLLTAIVQLRRDAFLLHAWDLGSCKSLRHAAILHETELFPRREVEAITEEWRKQRQDLSLRSFQSGRNRDHRSKPYTRKRSFSRESQPQKQGKPLPADPAVFRHPGKVKPTASRSAPHSAQQFR